MASRQREWQLKQVAAGKCKQCGKPRNLYAAYCDDCEAKHNKQRNFRNQKKRQQLVDSNPKG